MLSFMNLFSSTCLKEGICMMLKKKIVSLMEKRKMKLKKMHKVPGILEDIPITESVCS